MARNSHVFLSFLYVLFFVSQCYADHCEANAETYRISCENANYGYIAARWLTTETRPEYWIALFTAILTAATIALWLATRELFVGSERTSRAQLRAYVKQLFDDGPDKQGGAYVYSMGLQNTGVTPAYGVQVWSRSAALDLTEAKVYKFHEAPEVIDVPRFAIFPNTHMHAHGNKTAFTVQEMDDVRLCRKYLHVWGEIRYMDTFGRGQCTSFRVYYFVECGSGNWRYCDEGNDAT